MSCPVCFGGDDPVMRESLNAGIGVLLGVTGLVLASFARFFVGLARRSREAAHLVGLPPSPRATAAHRQGPGGRQPGTWELPAVRPQGRSAPDGVTR